MQFALNNKWVVLKLFTDCGVLSVVIGDVLSPLVIGDVCSLLVIGDV